MSSSKFNYIESVAFSDVGLIRTCNQDSVGCLQDVGCFFVSDGMGGGNAGEIASQLVDESVSDRISGSGDDCPGNRKYIIQQALHYANNCIQQYAQQHNYRQMGATLALLLLDSWDARQALICHIGDSRIYRLRNNELNLLTSDHTIGADLSAKTSQNKFTDHRNCAISHILTRAVGTSANIIPEWRLIDICPGDILLICSDGVSTMIPDRVIYENLHRDLPLHEISSSLSDAVRQAGASDNYSFVICRAAASLPEKEHHTSEDEEENNYLLKISEERIDYV